VKEDKRRTSGELGTMMRKKSAFVARLSRRVFGYNAVGRLSVEVPVGIILSALESSPSHKMSKILNFCANYANALLNRRKKVRAL